MGGLYTLQHNRCISGGLVDEVASFVIKNGQGLYAGLDWNAIKNFARQHIDYKTIIIVRDEEGILAVCRWNMPTKEEAYILGLVIRKGHTYRQLIKRILLKGLEMYPDAKYLIWERLKKYPNREQRKYLISDILRRKK